MNCKKCDQTVFDLSIRSLKDIPNGLKCDQREPSPMISSYNESGAVKLYETVGQNGTLSQNTYYPAGALSVETFTDEDGRTIEVFKNLQGHVLLERRHTGTNETNDTYYVYNERDQLRYVLQPLYQETEDLDSYAFQYKYNSKGLCVQKKLPGCAPVKYWYDAHTNRLAFYEDGNMRTEGICRFMLYDDYGRLTVQGICTNIDESGNINAQSYHDANIQGIAHTGYLQKNNFNLGTITLETANYYDKYDFESSVLDDVFSPILIEGLPYRAIGLKTGSITVTSSGERLYDIYFYDLKGRQINVVKSYPGHVLFQKSTSYSFTDKPACVTETLFKNETIIELSSRYQYNPFNDEIEKLTISYNDRDTTIVSQYTYDDLGRISQLSQGNDPFNTSYSYNVRGNLTNISSSFYQQTLTYADGTNPCYNGNISSMSWKSNFFEMPAKYLYAYDNLNRLTTANYQGKPITKNYRATLSYDANGNISTLTRMGNANNTLLPCALIDSLTYYYCGNQMTRVRDASIASPSSQSFHFLDNEDDDAEYEYDENGNMTKDLNKNILSITYNSLNLPQKVQFNYMNDISYLYNAEGTKLKEVYRKSNISFIPDSLFITPKNYVSASIPRNIPGVGGGVIIPPIIHDYYDYDSIDYCGNFIYRNNQLEQILFQGGYITVDSTDMPHYHFYQCDHLGSVRMVINESHTREYMNNYYPFGALFFISETQNLQRYKYNGKELDRMHGLNLLDYGARWYDPILGRFTTVDPLSEKYYNVSPYAYCLNNPISFVDKEGKRPSAYEAALMAAHVYGGKRSNNYLNTLTNAGWTISDFNTSIQMNYTNFSQNGLQSELFQKTKNGVTEYVYVFAGTDIYSLEDWIEDVAQVVGLSPQYSTAIYNAKTLSKEVGDNELTFVGHSLGGGEAAASSMATGRAAITFNPAAVSKFTSALHGLGSGHKITNYRAVGTKIGIGNIRVGGDVLNNLH